jgi:hypothetical protein
MLPVSRRLASAMIFIGILTFGMERWIGSIAAIDKFYMHQPDMRGKYTY